MSEQPLVSVICLCYNHSAFVEAALESVMSQTYPNVELIVIDDRSNDDSAEVIKKCLSAYPNVLFLKNESRVGNCRAFNKAFHQSKGAYIIDLAADDMLLTDRIATGVKDLEEAGPGYGVHFSNAEIIDQQGVKLNLHNEHGKPPEGDIYLDLIEKYFINPATMMMRRAVLEKLGGYNEDLHYEDFDFWIRSARNWKYRYNPTVLAKKRVVKGSLSNAQMRLFNKHQWSTYTVCRTISDLNQTNTEDEALLRRIRYEIRQCIRFGNLHLVPKYLSLSKEIKKRIH